MEELMKTTIIATLGLILLLAGTYRLQARGWITRWARTAACHVADDAK